MSLAYLFDPNKQFQDRNGVNNVSGFLRVYYEGTDDRATTYKNFIGTLNPADIPIDNDGRAVVIVDEEKTYRLEVYERNGNLQWTQHPVFPQGGGGSEYDGDVSDATSTFTKDEGDTSEISSGSTLKVLFTKISKFFASLARVAFTGSYNDLSDKPDVKKGKLHRIGVRMVQEGDPSPKPSTDWVIDLESPNSNEPDGYDRLTVSKAIELHENGEVFAFTSGGTDIYYESLFTSSTDYVHMTLVRSGFQQRPNEISLATVDNFGDYLGVSDAFADSEYWNVELVREGSDELRQNKIHRYSFGDATIDGETPVYGSWLIDLEKPDPNGPEGYARVTPYEFWKAVARNNEVPVYLQDKNSDNSLTYAYLSRADVTKSGSMVTNVFMFFVRSGYGNQLKASYGFKFTKLNGSDYIQKAAYDTDFDALSDDGDSGMTKPTFTTAQVVDNIASGERLKVMLGKIAKWFSAGFPIKNYGTKTIVLPNIDVDNNGYTKIVNPNSCGTVNVIINPVTNGEVPNVEIDIDNSESTSNTGVTVAIYSGGVYTILRNTTDTTPSVASGKIMHISAHGMGWRGTTLAT